MEEKRNESRTNLDRMRESERPEASRSPERKRTGTAGQRPLTGQRRPAGERPAGDRPVTGQRRPAGERPAAGQRRPAGERPAAGQKRPAGERPAGDRPAAGQRRPAGKRPATGQRRPAGERPAAGQRRPAGERPAEERLVEERPEAGQKRPAGRRRQSQRRRKRNLVVRGTLLAILLIVALAGAFLWKRYSPSKEKADLKEYYGIEKEGQLAITVNDQVVDPHGMISEGKAYIQYDIVRDYINSRFYWDPNENILLYTLPNDIVSVEVGSKDYSVSKDKKSEEYVILKTEGSTAYIALDFIQQFTNIEYEVYDGDPSHVMITSDWGKRTVATVKKDTQVRYRGGVKSPVLTEISKKDEVRIIESEANWKKICTKDGFVGYVKKSALRREEEKTFKRDFEEPKFTNIKKDYTINLAWHNVTNSSANDTVLQKIAESKGLTTIAPTWYHVKDTDGNLESISSAEYVNYAHQSNIEVWATVRDFDGGIGSYEESLAFLSSTSKREKLINQLIAEALQVGIDGINVDFEKISEECGEHYIQFIRELSVRCRQNGLVLSVDNYVPKGYNQQYDRKEQGIVADYVIIMGYDEHFAGSPEAGSVSSYNFVKEGIEETLKEVPAEKIISGIPFYTRLWEETPKTAEEIANDVGTDAEGYDMKVDSSALGMAAARERVEQDGAEIVWDEETKQNFATWTVDGTTYKIWLEDEKSIEPKLKLMKDHKLAGTAAWALGQETKQIWDLILKYVN